MFYLKVLFECKSNLLILYALVSIAVGTGIYYACDAPEYPLFFKIITICGYGWLFTTIAIFALCIIANIYYALVDDFKNTAARIKQGKSK